LVKRFYDGGYQIQIDQCPKCAGIFLDAGELESIRQENDGTAKRQEVIDGFMKQAESTRPEPHHSRGLKAVLGLLFK
jgi:Zn-finger nucleic acid-binding protein